MSGLTIAALLALLSLAALKFGARLRFKDMAPAATALLLGLAGYAWQGRPGLAGHPVQGTSTVRFDEQLAEKRRSIGERVGPASKWLILSDGLARQGNTRDAANVLLSGIKETPNDADLWVGLGNALLAHNAGRLSPAADNAYRQALGLQPEGISPNYFYGLALAQSGEFERGRDVWQALIPKLPEDADLRAELVRNVALLDRLIAARAAGAMGGE
jgi:cytochrome c-type biogenesis protein CcmH